MLVTLLVVLVFAFPHLPGFAHAQMCKDHYPCTDGVVKVNCSHLLIGAGSVQSLSIHQIGTKNVTKASGLETTVEVPLVNPDKLCFLKYICIWKIRINNSGINQSKIAYDKQVEIHNKTVTVNLKDLPLKPFNLTVDFKYKGPAWFALQAHFNVNTSKQLGKSTTYLIHGKSLQDDDKTQAPTYCNVNRGRGSCELLEDEVFKRYSYSVKALGKNSHGICYSSTVIKMVSVIDVHGSIRNFDVSNIAQEEIQVSWKSPREAYSFTSSVIYYLELCGRSCQNLTFPYDNDSTTKYIRSSSTTVIEPFTNYSVKMSYNMYGKYAPWTPTIHVRTLSEVPRKRVQQVECFFEETENGTGIRVNWEPPPEFKGKISQYNVALEMINHTETVADKCKADSCTHIFKNVASKTPRILITPCSNGGCAQKSVESICDLRQPHAEKLVYGDDKKNGETQKLIIVFCAIGTFAVFLIIAGVIYYGYRAQKRMLRLKKETSQKCDPVGPRDQYYEPCPEDNPGGYALPSFTSSDSSSMSSGQDWSQPSTEVILT